MMRTLLIGLSILCTSSGCFQKVQYIGRNYAASSKVEMFFSPVDVEKDYFIIGKVIGEPSNLKHAQKKFVEIAKENGADAIIIYVPGSEVKNVAHNRIITSTHVPIDGSSAGSSSTVTTIADGSVNTLYGELIKYK